MGGPAFLRAGSERFGDQRPVARQAALSVPKTLTPEQRAFLEENRFAVVGTVNPDGSPHLAVMWYLLDGDEVVVNSAQGRIKDRNLARDPRLSLLVADGYRFVRVDGSARIEHDQKIAHADIRRLAALNYGDERADKEMRTSFGKQHRISYRVPIGRVYSDGF
ncbi:MAG: PPOX class F420-dependent oxidoreductase [Chloroflexi bacterium]|nr:MAG: PPOX class F420-dependent oxidoreductase [Chloroflexota bacterium]